MGNGGQKKKRRKRRRRREKERRMRKRGERAGTMEVGKKQLGGNGDGDRKMDLAKVETKTQKRGGARIKEGEAQKVFAEGI